MMLQKLFLLVGLLLTVASPLMGQIKLDETRAEDDPYVRMFQFSPDGKTIVSYTDGGILLTWDIASRKLLRSQKAKTEKATLDPQGRLLSIVGGEGGVRLLDVVANQEVKLLEGADFTVLSKFDLSPDGKMLAFTEGTHSDVVKLWDVTTGKEKASIERPNRDDHLRTMLFSPDGGTLAILGNSITVWSVANGKQLRSIQIKGSLARLAFTPDGKKICVSGFASMNTSFIKCFGTMSGREVLSVPADPTLAFAFTPDGSVLALSRSGPDEGIFLVSMATGREIAKLTTSADYSSLSQMSFSPDGKLLAVGSTNGLVLFDPVARKELFILAQASHGPSGKRN